MKRAALNGCLFVGALLIFFHLDCAFSEAASNGDVFAVQLASYQKLMAYKVPYPLGSVSLENKEKSASPRLALEEIVSWLAKKHKTSYGLAMSLPGLSKFEPKWASIIPDHQFVLAGSQDPSLEAITSATLYRKSDAEPVLYIKSKVEIRDWLWARDSKYLILLESTEKMKKTPWGLFSALSGHPVELQTYHELVRTPITLDGASIDSIS